MLHGRAAAKTGEFTITDAVWWIRLSGCEFSRLVVNCPRRLPVGGGAASDAGVVVCECWRRGIYGVVARKMGGVFREELVGKREKYRGHQFYGQSDFVCASAIFVPIIISHRGENCANRDPLLPHQIHPFCACAFTVFSHHRWQSGPSS